MHWLSPAQVLSVVYVSEQCCVHAPAELMKQFGSLVQVEGSLMLTQFCEQDASLSFHVQVASPAHSEAVERSEQTSAQLPVAVTLQSGRAAHEVPTYGHCVVQLVDTSFHWQTTAALQSVLLEMALQFWRQMPATASHAHVPLEESQPGLEL